MTDTQFDLVKRHTDLYDVFGYFFPGILLLFNALIAIVLYKNKFSITRCYSFSTEIAEIFGKFNNTDWWIGLILFIFIIAVVYMLGHIISTISSLVIDKFLIKKISRYPYVKLFGFKKKREKIISKGFYKFVFMLINFTFLGLFFGMSLRYLKIIGLFIVFLMVVKAIVTERYRRKEPPKECSFLWYLGLIMASPFDLISSFIEKNFGLSDKFDKSFINSYMKKFESQFGEVDTESTNFFWLSYCYVVNSNTHLKEIVTHFLRLYGFTRNLSASFLLSSFYYMYLSYRCISVNDVGYEFRMTAFAMYVLFILLLIRFYYLYYNYYSKFVFRAFYTLNELEKVE